MKTIIRTLFYQYFLLFVGVSIGFIANAEYVGWKSIIVERSFRNIFFPIKYDEKVEQFVINFGRMRLSMLLFGHPGGDLTGILTDERVWGEEYYDALYKDPNNDDKIEFYQTRVRWKPWEYYYEWHSSRGDDLSDLIDIPPAAPPAPAPPAPAPTKPVTPQNHSHKDEKGRHVPGPVHIPDHPSTKPWWER